MYQLDLLKIQQNLIINKSFVKEITTDGYFLFNVNNQVMFINPRDSWELSVDPPSNPKNFWLTEQDIL
jgi:hypothetical protein